MQMSANCTAYRLAPSQQQWLTATAPGLLTVTDGVVWLTQGDGSEDHILAAGECARVAAGGRPIASALGGAASFDFAAVRGDTLAQAA